MKEELRYRAVLKAHVILSTEIRRILHKELGIVLFLACVVTT